ncbi:MAG: sensor histidine kinase [Proteobacteria bacterium]|nr:sensor histidine kinase [Pseudomonadota bacterium]
MMTRLDRRTVLLRYAGITMVIAAGLRAGYAAFFEPHHVAATSNWAVQFAVGYAVFVAAYVLMPTDSVATMSRRQAWSVAAQAVSGVYLVWLYPSFVVTCLLVVVAWQFALLLDFRRALLACAVQLFALAMIKCTGETDASFALIIASCGGFQLFAVCAAQLARSEMAARDELARANTELRGAQALLNESALANERLRIARELHDVMGHTLTTLTIHLDVANRLTSGPAAEHLAYARNASAELLEQVRAVVSRVRNTQPTQLRSALEELAASARGVLQVHLEIPPDLAVCDPAQAEVIIRCVQEVITNAMRHAQARQLTISIRTGLSGIAITACDDGRGGAFAPGNGLAGMRERFEALGGRLSVSSEKGRGFAIEGMLPVAGV